MNEEFKYRVVEEAEDFNNAVIEKSNVTVKFTMAQLNEDIERLAKLKRELEANIELRNAEMSNIESHHPEVIEAKEEEVFKAQTLAFYVEKKKDRIKLEMKLAEVLKAGEEVAQVIKDIDSQIGIPVNIKELNA